MLQNLKCECTVFSLSSVDARLAKPREEHSQLDNICDIFCFLTSLGKCDTQKAKKYKKKGITRMLLNKYFILICG